MSQKISPSRRSRGGVALAATALLAASAGLAHIVPPEELHPLTESYRRVSFLLGLNPVPWDDVSRDVDVIARGLQSADPQVGAAYATRATRVIREMDATGEEAPGSRDRRAATLSLFEDSTRAMAELFRFEMSAATEALGAHAEATARLEQARGLWGAFEHEVRHTDPDAYHRLGRNWLELNTAVGHPGAFGVGAVAPDVEAFNRNAAKLTAYVGRNFGSESIVSLERRYAAVPAHSPTFQRGAPVPAKLPPGADINKQLPRPRQILNMATRGVDEAETTLIALGDMAFDSHEIFGEPARSFGMSCNTCHNKGVTNPGFFIPGISPRKGALDVSNSYFAPHANNGHYDPLDIPDLRGIRFTAPYGRNGRFDSLREFTRNVIVNEFNGPEPDPMLLDGMVAYMLEIDFLPNPLLRPDGRLTERAPEAARRGEQLFNRPFAQMGDRSCATCHVPSDNFLDRKRHDIGTVAGAEDHSRDRTMDTPTLLSAAYSAPYFHDGSAPTLRSVNEWFDRSFGLGLTEQELDDLTAYVETVGSGVEAYEDTLHTLEAEMEEFSFFLSTYEFLESRNKRQLMDVTFATVAYEIRAHKWDVQNPDYLPVLDRLAELMDVALAANQRGEHDVVDTTLDDYRDLYERSREQLK